MKLWKGFIAGVLATLILFPSSSFAEWGNKERIYDLSSNDIYEAIWVGQESYDAFVQKVENKHLLNLKETNLGVYQPEFVRYITPYYDLALFSKICYHKGGIKLYYDEAKEYYEKVNSKNIVEFTVFAMDQNINVGEYASVYIKQGEKLIWASSLEGNGQIGKPTASFPKKPEYERGITVKFNRDEIDFEQPAELVFNLYSDKYAIYSINFTEFR